MINQSPVERARRLNLLDGIPVVVSIKSPCWIWTRRPSMNGYGRIGITGLAHRASYEAFVGPIPSGLHIDHLCRVRRCVNPAHLEPVTCKENILRGESPEAKFARQTHCKDGHPFDVHARRLSDGRPYGRSCKRCDARRSRESRARIKARETGAEIVQ